MTAAVTAEEEAAHLLALYERDVSKVLGAVEHQLDILMSRAQTLLSLAGLTLRDAAPALMAPHGALRTPCLPPHLARRRCRPDRLMGPHAAR